jgi:hypothetical protein
MKDEVGGGEVDEYKLVQDNDNRPTFMLKMLNLLILIPDDYLLCIYRTIHIEQTKLHMKHTRITYA